MENGTKTCFIISGGDFAKMPYDIPSGAFITACDCGLDHAMKMGIVPDLVIGDLDSVSDKGKRFMEDNDIKCLLYPSDKDDTDTALAVKYLISQGFNDLRIMCAFGGRYDHELGNIAAARYAALRGAVVRLEGADTRAVVFSGRSGSEGNAAAGSVSAGNVSKRSVSVERADGFSLSVISLTDKCSGVYIKGAKYELENAVINGDSTLGVSNEFVDDTVTVSVGDGVLMVVMARM
ncbi:MAG: thiamine diphosphokinase [Lachnospiraceae bacterium]|nr:thiamine diphosphokinase [Lachnospiraceae bacterium]